MITEFRQILVSKKFHVATSKILANAIYNSTYTAVGSEQNAYTDVSSTTRAQLTVKTGKNASSMAYFGFDTSSIPSNAYINKVTIKIKTMSGSTTRLTSIIISTCKGTTKVGSFVNANIAQASTNTLITTDWTRQELDNMRVSIEASRGSSGQTTATYVYIYGIEATIDYEYWA